MGLDWSNLEGVPPPEGCDIEGKNGKEFEAEKRLKWWVDQGVYIRN